MYLNLIMAIHDKHTVGNKLNGRKLKSSPLGLEINKNAIPIKTLMDFFFHRNRKKLFGTMKDLSKQSEQNEQSRGH